MIYLDYNATAPMRPTVAAAMAALAGKPLNPSSVHAGGREAKKLLEDARAAVAAGFSAFPNEVMFVASATEANNMVLRAFADSHALLVPAIEHPSIGKLASQLGGDVLPVDERGIVKLDILEAKLKNLGGRKALVSVMLANNETGVIQPIAEISALVHAHGGLMHTDAVQGIGRLTMDWGLLGVDMLTVSGHKAGGPVGAGALLIRNDLPIRPMLVGGGQELNRRASTHNLMAIHGFAQLVKEVALAPDAAQWQRWRDALAAELEAAGGILHGKAAPRLPNTLNISMPGVKSETQLMNLDLAGFAVSAGSACSSGRIDASPILLAMGASPELASSAIRISFGVGTGEADLKTFASAWKAMFTRLASKAA